MSTYDATRHRIGKQLYVAAWIVEIAAASLGLALGFLNLALAKKGLLSDHTTLASSDNVRIFLAGLPFLVVAVVELMKIPIAATCYFSVTKRAKWIFGFSLLLLSLITFETFLTGLEQNSAIRLLSINKIKDEIVNHNKQYQDLEAEEKERNSKPNKQAIHEKYKNDIDRYKSEEIETLKGIDREIKEIRQATGGIRLNIENEIKATENGIKNSEQEIHKVEREISDVKKRSVIDSENEKLIRDESSLRKKSVPESIEGQKDILEKQLQGIQENIQRLDEKENDDCGFFGTGDCEAIRADQAKDAATRTALINKIAKLSVDEELKKINDDEREAIGNNREDLEKRKQKEVNELLSRIGTINRNIAEKKSQKADWMSKLRALSDDPEYLEGQKKIERKKDEKEIWRETYKQKRATLELERNEDIKYDDEKKSRLKKISEEKIRVESKITELENEWDKKARGNQFYRFAMMFMPGIEGPEDVTTKHLRIITLVWFLSLAGITAWMGTLLAFASFVLRYGPSSQDLKPSPSKSNRYFKRLCIDARRYIRKPRIKEIKEEVEKTVIKEVIKEVPVDKVVVQEVIKEVPVDRVVTQDVPKEVIRKEVIHVPIASDDLAILDIRKPKSPQTEGQSEDVSQEDPQSDKNKNSTD
tara:strand:- start:827 stop:2767 length:1941 start_codon:yes stop_codon:yes gene_type:complete